MAALVETMMYVREKPWHGLGTEVQEAVTAEEAIELAGLNWEVEGRPVFDAEHNIIAGYQANTRSTDHSVLGIVSDKYRIVQNREAFDFTDALIGEGLRYETAGSLKNGKQIWLLGKMPDRDIVGDKFEPYICFTNTHDGSGAVKVAMTPIRVVCNNTLNLALSSAKRSWSAVHKGNISQKMDEARQTLSLADLYLSRLSEEADFLANKSMTEGEMRDALNKMIPMPADATDRQKKTIEETQEQIMICTVSPDLLKFLNTRWAFVNAVSDYVGHGKPGRQTKNYEENRWGRIINGHVLLDRALAQVGV